MAKIAVLEFEQAPESNPVHFVSKKMADAMLAYRHHGKKAVKKLGDRLLQIAVNLSFRKLKGWLKGPEDPLSLPQHTNLAGAPYIPPDLPLPEVEGLKFQLGGKIQNHGDQHRLVSAFLALPSKVGQVQPTSRLDWCAVIPQVSPAPA